MTRRPLLPWRSGLLLAAVVAIAVPVAALWLDGSDDRGRLLVLAPSSLAPIEDELTAALNDGGIGPIEWVFAGSQSLVAQLADGVPADVVLVADTFTLDAVTDQTDALTGARIFASNRLVLAVAPDNPGAVSALADLADPDRLIGVCAAEVPCGRLASTALSALGLTPSPDTEETSVRALTSKLVSGELDAGLVYRTDAIAAGLEVVAEDELRPFENTYHGVATTAGRPLLDALAEPEVAAVFDAAGFGR